MAITEEPRHHLYQRLEEVLGPEEATTLMQHMPPVGWADVATKQDLDHLTTVLTLRMDNAELRTEHRFDAIDQRFDERLTTGLAGLEVRMLSALGDFRDEFHAEQRSLQRQVILLWLATLITISAASIGLR